MSCMDPPFTSGILLGPVRGSRGVVIRLAAYLILGGIKSTAKRVDVEERNDIIINGDKEST